MTNDNYIYNTIIVVGKTGNKYDYNYCDYYIQDNILTVFRKTQYKDRNGTTYYKFESHFPWDSVENVRCIIK